MGGCVKRSLRRGFVTCTPIERAVVWGLIVKRFAAQGDINFRRALVIV